MASPFTSSSTGRPGQALLPNRRTQRKCSICSGSFPIWGWWDQASPAMCDGRRTERVEFIPPSCHLPLDLSLRPNERQPALCDVEEPRPGGQAGREGRVCRVLRGALGCSSSARVLRSVLSVLRGSRGLLGKCGGQQKRDRLCWGKHSSEPSFSSGSRHSQGDYLFFLLNFFFRPEISCMGPGGEKII